jgi:hypothetical protein
MRCKAPSSMTTSYGVDALIWMRVITVPFLKE